MTIQLHRAALRQISDLLEVVFGLADEEEIIAFFDRLGWDFSALAPPSVDLLIGAAESIASGVLDLRDALEKPDLTIADIAPAIVMLAQSVPAIVKAVSEQQFAVDIPADTPARIAEDVASLLAVTYVHAKIPRVALVFELLGIIVRTDLGEIKATDGRTLRRAQRVSRLQFDALEHLLSDPIAYLERRYLTDAGGNWLAVQGIADVLGPVVADGLNGAGIAAAYGLRPGALMRLTPAEQTAADRMLMVELDFPDAQPSASIRFVLALTDSLLATDGPAALFGLTGDVGLTRKLGPGTLGIDLAGATTPLILSRNGVRTSDGQAAPGSITAKVTYTLGDGTAPAARFGAEKGTHFEIGTVAAQFALSVAAAPDVEAGISMKGVALSIQAADGDGFLGKVLPKDPIRVQADLGFDWSLRKGLTVQGGAGFEKRIASGVKLGPIELIEALVAVRASEKGLSLSGLGSVKLTLGPIEATVERLGLSLQLKPAVAADGSLRTNGNLGIFDVGLGFTPPKGVGMKVAAGPVRGGGYVRFDFDEQQYAGVLQLSIRQISLTAIGLIATRLPDRKPGFSLLVIITAEFPPLQLGMGFTLNGLGGLLGIHRTADVDVLRAGLRHGALDAILFPPDPLKDVIGLLNTVSSVFPVAEGRFVFGPMAKIGWGSPTLLTLDIALILEIPDPVRIILLGRLKATLPDAKAPVATIRMDALGVLDFERQELSLDASLYDSKLLTFTLTGDMAMRLSWGATPNFLLSIGGFHPHFTPPASIPKLARMGIVFVDKPEARVRLESYMALTSNTVQFGARVELMFASSGFKAEGFLGFDALFHFSPFALEVDLGAAVTVTFNGVMLMGVELLVTLTGPTPWHIVGQARFAVLGFKVEAPVELKFGDDTPPPLPPPVDVLGLVHDALADLRNWQPLVPADAQSIAGLPTAAGDAHSIVIHPLGILQVRQRVVPLGTAIERFSGAPIQGDSRFDVRMLRAGAPGALTTTPLDEPFAMAQYLVLSDDAKLARPAFEPRAAGLELGDDTFVAATAQAVLPQIEYATLTIDGPGPAVVVPGHVASADAVNRMIALGAAARAPSRTSGPARYFPVDRSAAQGVTP